MAKRWPLAFLLLLALALPGQLSAASNIYPPSNICDATTAGQCAAVSAAGAVSIAGTITTTPSGTQNVAPVGGGAALFPNAATLGDGVTLPTATIAGSVPFLYNGSTMDIPRNTAALVDGAAAKQIAVSSYLFNGTTWDRPYNNTPSATVGITCAACSSTQTGGDQTNFNGRGVRCTYDATIVTSVGSFTVEIDGKDEVSGKYYSLLTTTAVSTVSTNILTVYPGVTPVSSAPNFATSIPVPRTWRVKATFNSGTNQTFTIGCNTLV